jgi:RNA polymerase sigma factor (sigma-70 family)
MGEMHELSDAQLLRAYAERGHEPAFREIVTRHTDLVYSAALRQVASPDLARDVAQGVFTDLARKARPLAGKIADAGSLAGWLHRSTRYAALNHLRDTRRRHTNERLAMEQLLTNSASAPDWEHIRPVLDEALDSLGDEDREALLLRYFKNQDLRSVGRALGVSDDAAQKRVSRAVESLREFFTKRNVTIGASGLAILISANAVQSAPVGLSAAILTAAIETTKTIGITMIHKILITGMTAAAVGTGLYAFHLQSQIGPLQQQQASLGRQIEQLSRERDDATNQLAAWQQENGQSQANETELLKLRDEVSRLGRQPAVSPVAMPSKTNNLPRAETITILLRTQFVSLPSEDLQTLGGDWMSGATLLLTQQQFKVINEALQGANDVNLISAPRAITINGQQAQMSVTRSVQVDGTNANVGTSLEVTPYFSTNSATFNLNLGATWTQLTGDPSQPGFQTMQATNQVTLSPGQTVVLEKEIPPGGWLPGATNVSLGSRSLLVFVTPSVVDDAGNQIKLQ